MTTSKQKAAPAKEMGAAPVRMAVSVYRDGGAWTVERLTVQGDVVVKREVKHARDIKPIILGMAQDMLEALE